MGIDKNVIRNDRKYNLIRPFWLVRFFEAVVCKVEVVLGIAFSSQIKSNSCSDVLKLFVNIFSGRSRCMIKG